MELQALKLLGAGFAAIGMIGSGIGLGNIFATYLSSVARNPASQPKLTTYLFIGFAATEAVALFAFVVAMLILFS